MRKIQRRGIPKHRNEKKREMPIGFQIWNIKRLFEAANAGLSSDYIDFDLIDNEASYSENLEIIKEGHPQFRWKAPKEMKKSPAKEKIHWIKHSTDSYVVYMAKVPIKSHIIKRKVRSKRIGETKYVWHKHYGRIQVVVDKEWIGEDATVIVRMPQQ